MLDELRAAAMLSAPSQLTVEGVVHVSIKRADLYGADEGPNVLLRIAAIRVQRRPLELGQLEVLVQQLVDRCSSLGVAAFVDLVPESPQNALGLGCHAGARGHDFTQTVPPLRDGVVARVDVNPKRVIMAAGADTLTV